MRDEPPSTSMVADPGVEIEVDEAGELSFHRGSVEAILAACYGIADSKRSTFSSRLKNFHRLKFPLGFQPQHGKAARYSVGDLVMMALALEMTNLGLTPERIVRVLSINWFPTFMALRMAASWLLDSKAGLDPAREREDGDRPPSMFLYFDPAALMPLRVDHDPRSTPDLDEASDTFFYGGEGIVRESIVNWTSGECSRLSLINVSSMIDRLVWAENEKTDFSIFDEFRREFFQSLLRWTLETEVKYFMQEASEEAMLDYLEKLFDRLGLAEHQEVRGEILDRVIGDSGFKAEFVERAMEDYIARNAQEAGGNVDPKA